MSAVAGAGGTELLHRYALAAHLCRGLRVLDLGEAPPAARGELAEAAAELVVGTPGEVAHSDAVVVLDGLLQTERREQVLSELERHASAGGRVIVALESRRRPSRLPRVEASKDADPTAVAGRFPGAIELRQFLVEGSLIAEGPEQPNGEAAARLMSTGDREEDAAAVILVVGFDRSTVQGAQAAVRMATAPVVLSYLQRLERAHAELLRANRELMRERLGNEGSAAASLLDARRRAGDAERRLKEMEEIARGQEQLARTVKAWYDAPRYHMVDRLRNAIKAVPGLARVIRFTWGLISTRPENPALELPVKAKQDDVEEPAASDTEESEETSTRLEQ